LSLNDFLLIFVRGLVTGHANESVEPVKQYGVVQKGQVVPLVVIIAYNVLERANTVANVENYFIALLMFVNF